MGSLLVGLLNVYIFSDIKSLNKEGLLLAYANIYLIALFIPILSVSGVILSKIFKSNFELKLTAQNKTNNLDLKIFWGSIFFVLFAILFGNLKFPFAQEFVLITSLVLIYILMNYLVKPLSKEKKFTIIGTAIIILFIGQYQDLEQD